MRARRIAGGVLGLVAFLAVLAVGLPISGLLAGLVSYGDHALGLRILAVALAVPGPVLVTTIVKLMF